LAVPSSCYLYALVGFVCVYAVLGQLEGKPKSADAIGQVLYAGAAVLLPLNLTVFACLDERGLFSRLGLIRLSFFWLKRGLFML
tara:strand:+ start:291 stop:542 length:252 start_codon:yes stop_codon:yes gene_type:complete